MTLKIFNNKINLMNDIDSQPKKSIDLYRLFLFIGLGLIVLYYIPYLAAGENSHIRIFDNLDSEILFYKLSGKYLLSFNGNMPEIMDGLSVGSVNVFSPIQTLIYMVLPTFWAYIFNDFFVKITGFLGLYFLLNRIIQKEYCYISFFASLIFALLPVFSVYGLSIYGQPILVLAVWNLYKNQKKAISYLLIAFFGVSSSLILTGYYLLVYFGILALVVTIKKGFKNTYHLWIGLALLTGIYVLTNIKMIYMTLFDNYVSMRIERIERSLIFMNRLTSTNFFEEVFVLFFVGQVHAASGQIYSFLVLIPMAIIAIVKDKNNELNQTDKKYLKIVWLLVGYNFLCAIINGLYYTKPVTFIIDHLGVLKGFQFHRMFLSYAVTWAIIFAISLKLLVDWGVFENLIKKLNGLKKPACIVLGVILCVVMSYTVLGVYEFASPDVGYYATINSVFDKDRIKENYPTYKQYVDEELFKIIKDHIGKPQDEYKVVSLGIYPAIASMNGFYTLDGFFQNYPLEYKHEFREIIAGELEKSEHLRQYFDYWGNKCYILSAEIPKIYTVSKNAGKQINDLDINTQKLKEMGCQYIFSALPINNFDELGLTLDGVFERQNSYWKIYLYNIV